MRKKTVVVLALLSLAISAFAAVRPVSRQVLELKPGWNLVTIAKPLVDDSSKSIEHFLELSPFVLNPSSKCLVQCLDKADIKVGAGFYIFSRSAKSVEIVFDATQTSWDAVEAVPGWNLLGIIPDSTWQGEATQCWQWLDGCFQDIATAQLEAGNAYWGLIPEDK